MLGTFINRNAVFYLEVLFKNEHLFLPDYFLSKLFLYCVKRFKLFNLHEFVYTAIFLIFELFLYFSSDVVFPLFYQFARRSFQRFN